MRTLSRDQIPADYQYYGAAAPEIIRFLQSEVFGFKSVPLGNGEYGWLLNLFWGFFSFGRFEKCSIEPTAGLLRKHGFKRGLILWSPWNTLISPAGW